MSGRFPGETDDTFFPGEPRPKTEDEETAERVVKEKLELRRAGLISVMGYDWFREWLMDYLVSLNTFGTTFAVSPTGFPDPNATFFHMGMKSAGESLWEQFDSITPELAALMRREARTPKA